MMDPREFKAPFITIADIRRAVDDFRKQYWSKDTIPVDIFEIVEFELGIELPDKYYRKDEFPAEETDPTSLGFNGDNLVQIPVPAAPPAVPPPKHLMATDAWDGDGPGARARAALSAGEGTPA